MKPESQGPAARALALLVATSCLYFFTRNLADNDLWGHLLFGREIWKAGALPDADPYSYTVGPGDAWINHEWLSQIALALAYGALGAPGLLLLKLALGLAAAWFSSMAIGSRGLGGWVCSAILLAEVAALSRGFAFRPQIFTYAMVAYTYYALSARERGSAWPLRAWTALFPVWVNMHGGFLVGLALAWGFAVWQLAKCRGEIEPLLCAFLASLLVLANPFGFELLHYIVDELGRPHPITEWQSVSLGDTSQLPFFLLAALFLVSLPLSLGRFREEGWHALAGLVALYLALKHQRHTALFAVCGSVSAGWALAHARAWLDGLGERAALGAGALRIVAIALCAMALLQLVLTADRLRRDGLQIVYEAADYPTGAVEHLKSSGFTGNLAVPLEWGEFALWHLWPKVKVSFDGRFATVYSREISEINFDFASQSGNWRALIDRFPTSTALLPAAAGMDLTRLAGWRLAYEDSVAGIYTSSAALPTNRTARGEGSPRELIVFP